MIVHTYGIAKIADLMRDPRNARKHPREQIDKIVKAIKEFGFTTPALINGDGKVIAGHGRLEALAILGETEIPAITVSGLTPSQEKALAIADNRLPEDAAWNEERLTEILHELNGEDFDLTLTGFDDAEIFAMLKPLDDDDKGAGEGSDDEGAGDDADYLRFGDCKARISEVEIGRLAVTLERYREENGSSEGFASFLMDNLAW